MDIDLTGRDTQVITCSKCNCQFLFRPSEQTYRNGKPSLCPNCYRKKRDEQKKKKERLDAEKRKREKELERIQFDDRLKSWQVVALDDIHPENDNVLYILGNGFDMMHAVPSSYYAFRDTLGKNSDLRFMLETYLTPEDIWADFEDALAHFYMEGMGSRFIIDSWLNDFNAYDEDAQVADYYLAIEAAANPMTTISSELPRRFRRWVESLAVGTDDRPLKGIFRNGKVLCFNYTEFVETMYGISNSNVCYIHGCRKNKKGRPKEDLILGHQPGASDASYDIKDRYASRPKDTWRRYLLDSAQDEVFRLVAESDRSLTKDTHSIIAAHENFFSKLSDIENIIVIGHSLSPVDRDYFAKITTSIRNIEHVRWFFGCRGLRNLDNIDQTLTALGIDRSNVYIFRTDDISVTPLPPSQSHASSQRVPREKKLGTSPSGKWTVKSLRSELLIVNNITHCTDYRITFSYPANYATFLLSDEHLFVILRGTCPGIFFFHLIDGHWSFMRELEHIPYQSVLNRRLTRVIQNNEQLIFVYNNRIRKYSLSDGTLLANQALRNARNQRYDGTDVSDLFIR